ncbi:hypothetical protein [uncultured Aquimarina sp.]|uniref:hypothetical protein n=1 Tax=uncultured Aquimarina sp. TaxID=575652 RepID=UPI002616DA0A|nr:hypothetical protein [uncultured Aquimarina sp.]
MPISVCKNHSSKSLIEIYKEVAYYNENPVWKIKSKEMINLIELINILFKDTQIWGLTSHDRLVLLSENNWESRWHVIIENIGSKEFYFEYLMPENKSPWENGIVKGVAGTISEVERYLAIAMRESEGWNDNLELENLLNRLE